MADRRSPTHEILRKYESEVLADWMTELTKGLHNDRRMSESDLSAQSREFLTLIQAATANNGIERLDSASWTPMFEFLDAISHSRAQQGYNSSETATFVFSLKKPLFDRLCQELSENPQMLAEETWRITELLDKLGMHTVQTFQKAREAVISRQQEELLELSTPVVKLWEGILALPMIGTLDSARTQVVMESLSSGSSTPVRRSPSSTSPVYRRSIPLPRSICSRP